MASDLCKCERTACSVGANYGWSLCRLAASEDDQQPSSQTRRPTSTSTAPMAPTPERRAINVSAATIPSPFRSSDEQLRSSVGADATTRTATRLVGLVAAGHLAHGTAELFRCCHLLSPPRICLLTASVCGQNGQDGQQRDLTDSYERYWKMTAGNDCLRGEGWRPFGFPNLSQGTCVI